MKEYIKDLENKILSGENITFKETMKLSNMDDRYIDDLCESATKIQEFFCGREIDLCTIMNAKSGECTEDCKFCAQSSHYKTDIETFELTGKEEVIRLAKENEEEGVNRFSLVTGSRDVTGDDFEKIVDIYEHLEKEVKMDLCASLGILDYERLSRLRKKGITMYHHNLETSRDYYKEICTTHNYDARIETIKHAKASGMSICSGGIIGLGESREDRVSLAFELKKLEVESIPINVLNPVKGTPLENEKPLSQNEILKTIAIFRLVNPNSSIRLAGGRNLIDENGKKCFKSGANATITGNYLTTSGNKICDDRDMINELDFEFRKN